MYWYLKVLRQYFDFQTRASRKEYWMFVLFNIIFSLVAMMLDDILGITFNQTTYGPFSLLYGLAVFIPGIAVSVRRLHDIGKSGWMILVSLIPVIGPIWFLFMTVQDSQPDENRYGLNPK